MAYITDPNTDGIDHINIYSRGATELGRFLSNFCAVPFQISLGRFASIEGLIYFLGSFDDELRKLSGYPAKQKGRELDRQIRLPEDVFRKLIKEAMIAKLKFSPRMTKALQESSLPFSHYYVVKGSPRAVPAWHWQLEIWEQIRLELKSQNQVR